MDTEILREHVEARFPGKVVDVNIFADMTSQIRTEKQRAFVSEQLDSFKAVLRKTGVRPRLVTGPLAVFGRGEKADAISVLAAELERLEQESAAQHAAGASTNTTHAFVTFADSKASDEFQRTGRERALGDKADDNRAYVLEASSWSIKQVTAATCRKPRRTPADLCAQPRCCSAWRGAGIGRKWTCSDRSVVLSPARLRRCPTSCGRTCRSTPTAKCAPPLSVGPGRSVPCGWPGGLAVSPAVADRTGLRGLRTSGRAGLLRCGGCTSGRPIPITACHTNDMCAAAMRLGRPFVLWVGHSGTGSHIAASAVLVQVGSLLHTALIGGGCLLVLALPLMVVVWFGYSPDLSGEFAAVFVPPLLVRLPKPIPCAVGGIPCRLYQRSVAAPTHMPRLHATPAVRTTHRKEIRIALCSCQLKRSTDRTER
jgi:hypothetical protein